MAVLWRIAATGITVFSIANIAKADAVPLVDINPAAEYDISFDEPNTDSTWGWTFLVESPVQVTHVAWYDEDGDGLSHPHRIGLWKDLSGATHWPFISTAQSQQILKSPVPGTFPPTLVDGIAIPSGAAAQLVNGWWRRVPLPNGPLVLAPGGYALGGTDDADSTDAIRYHLDFAATAGSGNSLPADSRIQIGAPGYSQELRFAVPSLFLLVSGVELGPMLFVEPIPEPATGALAGLGFVGVVAAARRRK